ncbi:MAG: ATP-binding protein [Proteobacteria bacterium]|nr:ATP-binding protein [Pseudomonadota bacterium]
MWHKKMKRPVVSANRRKGVDQSHLWLECARRGLASAPLIKSALQQLSIDPSDFECEQLIENQIHSMDVQDILNPDSFRRTNPDRLSNVTGPIQLGKVRHTNVPWGIYPKALTEHTCLIGRTGGGKTTVIKAIIRQLLERRAT